jgi:mRNA interferase RelE/StbE
VAYALEVHRRARRFLEDLARGSPADYERIEEAIDGLVDDPRPPGTAKLRGRGLLWRVRVGEYRIVYSILDPDQVVNIEYILRRTTRTYRGT